MALAVAVSQSSTFFGVSVSPKTRSPAMKSKRKRPFGFAPNPTPHFLGKGSSGLEPCYSKSRLPCGTWWRDRFDNTPELGSFAASNLERPNACVIRGQIELRPALTDASSQDQKEPSHTSISGSSHSNASRERPRTALKNSIPFTGSIRWAECANLWKASGNGNNQKQVSRQRLRRLNNLPFQRSILGHPCLSDSPDLASDLHFGLNRFERYDFGHRATNHWPIPVGRWR